MPQSNDLSRCLIPFRQDETLVAVVEMSKTSWLVAGMIPGVARHPLKKLVPDEKALFELLERWRDEAVKAGKIITRITVAYEAGRDGFWLARWLRARGFEVYVVHSSSVAVTREHRRAKTDRLDCEMLKRVFIGWCAASGIIVAWSRSQRRRRRMPSARTASARTWSASAHASWAG